MSEYPTLIEILAIHHDQIALYGGATGVRDFGLIESALFRPQTGYYSDLIQEAAALWESLSQNHPFIDGNKRVAFAATDTFLRMNGLRISSDPLIEFQELNQLYTEGEFNFVNLERWLRSNTASIDAWLEE